MSYKDAHDELNLQMLGPTYGESLEHQGLSSLADWTQAEGKPGITGIIIDRTTSRPGGGYFRLFGRTSDDFGWWAKQVRQSKQFDWSPYLPNVTNLPINPPSPAPASVPPSPPPASVIKDTPVRQEVTVDRILRDTNLSRMVKAQYDYKCQICGYSIVLPDGTRYAEGHHLKHLGEPHRGPDIIENILCLCPNHHAELDLGARLLQVKELKILPAHPLGDEYIRYHNEVICKGNK